jgi:hypothetical protein
MPLTTLADYADKAELMQFRKKTVIGMRRENHSLGIAILPEG